MTGRTISHYEILEKLGEGGMGVVYKARDTRLNRLVALKLLPEEHARDDDRLRRFTQEARAASALNHPNIITIHDIGAEDGSAYIVMEYVAGKTLDQLIPPKGMRVAEALKIATQMADALAAAAAAGVVHRDIKPGNIMVTDSGLVKVLDFGLAKMAERASNPADATATLLMADAGSPRTREGSIVGTVSYMSPEQAEGKPLDPRSDIFSFGAVLYEMVTGQRPFRGETGISTITSILRDEPTPPAQIGADVPQDLEKIISRCLRKDPARRFQNMADVRVALLELKEETESGVIATPAPARQRISWKLPVAFALVLAAAGAAATYWVLSTRPAAVPEAEMRLVPFTSYRYSQSSPAFSPDGNQIAFTWPGEPGAAAEVVNPHIYVKMIGNDTPLRLTSADATDRFPAWAPGGQTVAFVRYMSADVIGIFQVGALGGSERLTATLFDGPSPRLSWSADGKWIVASGREAKGAKSRIFVVSAENGEKHMLNFGDTGLECSAALSPDSRWLVFSRMVSDVKWGLFVVAMDGKMQPSGTPRQLNTPQGVAYGSAWTSDSREIVFALSNPGSPPLWRIAANGRTPARILSVAPEGTSDPAISMKKNRLAFDRRLSDSNIWQFPVEGPGKLGSASEFIASTRPDRVRPDAWSPDGRKVAFESSRSGWNSVWVAGADGAKATLLFGGADYTSGSPAWSPDGRWVAVDSFKDKQSGIYVIPAGGGAARRLLKVAWNQMVPIWSRDGKWVYFSSERTGRAEVYRVPAEGGEPQQVTQNGGFGAMESPDGRYLYYTRANVGNGSLFRMPAAGGEETEVVKPVDAREWAVTADGVWFAALNGAAVEVRYLNSRTGKVSTAARITRPVVPGLALSPDGRSLLYTQIDQQVSEIQLVENFR